MKEGQSRIPVIKYNDQYREACFYTWYNNGRSALGSVKGNNVVKLMPPDPETGEKPQKATIQRWMKLDGWVQHADALDAEVSIKLDQEAIENRIVILRQLAEDGKSLKEKGLGYLNSSPEPFKDNPSAAVRAIVAGSEMEFKYAGQADMLANVAGMTNKQLDKELNRLLGKTEYDADAEVEDVEESEDSEENAKTDND